MRLGPRRGRRSPTTSALAFALALLVCIGASLAPFGRPIAFCSAGDPPDGDDDDFLAEILAEQAREDEELARMEAEAREYEAMKARQPSPSGGGGRGGGRGGPGKGRTGGGAGGTMPKGASGANFSRLEEDLKKREAEGASRRAAREEELAAADAERTRLERESRFEADLKRMNEEQRKRARRQKARDARVVGRILRAHRAGRHYAVLGLRNLEVRLGPMRAFGRSFGPYSLFRVPAREIKRAYRNLARVAHPDKNRDGRAEEAFRALEESAAVLTDEGRRAEYDRRIISARRRRNRRAVEGVLGAGQLAWTRGVSMLRVAKRVLGPFSTPILVVGALII